MSRQRGLQYTQIALTLLGICFLGVGLPTPSGASAGATYTYVLPVSPYPVDELNACDSHVWASEPWGGTTALTWKTFHGRRCMQAAFTSTGSTEAYLRTDHFFSPEDWSTVTQIKLDVYPENGKINLGLRLELKDAMDATKASVVQPSGTISPDTWNTITFNITPTGFETAKLFLVLTDMATGNSVCFSNLRIHRTTDEMWDTLTNPSYAWQGDKDFVPWAGGNRNEPISHKVTYNSSAGALCIPWTQTGNNQAEMKTTTLHYHNFVDVSKFRAQVYSDRAGVSVSVGFWNDASSQWAQTGWITVPTAGVWQSMEWDRPTAPFAWNNDQNRTTLIFIVNDTIGGSGVVYIDDIEFVK